MSTLKHRLSQFATRITPPRTFGSDEKQSIVPCHEVVVRILPCVSPEVMGEIFFLFSSEDWEVDLRADCDASSPLNTPGIN